MFRTKLITSKAKDYNQFGKILEVGGEEAAADYIKSLASVYGVGRKCFRCGLPLLETDVKGYHSVCLMCDENFYSFEEV